MQWHRLNTKWGDLSNAMSNEGIVKELESLKRMVEFFPVETYLNGERFCCDCVEEINEKITEYL